MAANELEGISPEDRQSATKAFLTTYSHGADKDTWFENMKNAAINAGYAIDRKDFKENPDKYKGGISEFAKIIRVSLTGKSRNPDLWTIMQIMGEERVKNRLS